MTDVLLVGGGVIGLTTALELSEAGLSVTVVDRGPVGREASWAGAGMIPPGDPFGTAAARHVNALSARLWPELSQRLRDSAGIDNGYRRCGGIVLSETHGPPVQDLYAAYSGIDVSVDLLTGAELRSHEPTLSPSIGEGLFLPGMAQVRNPWHLRALTQVCRERGVAFREGEPIHGFERRGDRIQAAVSPHGRIPAGTFVVTAGAWSAAVLASSGIPLEVKPIRGQIVLLNTPCPLLRHILEIGPRYLVPRADGRLLVGSTEEEAGFRKENTAAGISGLLELARTLVPETASARFETCWSGLRPFAVRGRPFLGPVPETPNLLVATGHFRSGLTNSPGTARVLRELIAGQPTSIDVTEFAIAN